MTGIGAGSRITERRRLGVGAVPGFAGLFATRGDEMEKRAGTVAALIAGIVFCFGTAPGLMAASVQATVDNPFSFRATFTGMDTDPQTYGGNDFQVFTFDYWTVLVNLRADAVDTDGNASGFYEIQLTHSGSKVADATAPVVNTFLFYGGLLPGKTLTDSSVGSRPHGSGAEYLSTIVNILFDPPAGTVQFAGEIAGDTDLNGDGVVDSEQTDAAVKRLLMLRDVGVITGKEMGQIIKQTRQPSSK